jgi:hypothetical protein
VQLADVWRWRASTRNADFLLVAPFYFGSMSLLIVVSVTIDAAGHVDFGRFWWLSSTNLLRLHRVGERR